MSPCFGERFTLVLLGYQDVITKFRSHSRWKELSKETISEILPNGDGSRREMLKPTASLILKEKLKPNYVERASILHQPDGVRSKRHHIVPFGDLSGVLVALVDRLSLEQQADLERNVFNEEIKSAVWDCGTNKSPGPDGFIFEFFRRYWKLLEHDIVEAVKEFFASSTFPAGSNFSFIDLIPKIHDAKVIKDYRHISLIGSLCKIIAKILANRLRFVISGFISDVQLAFVSKRQILDGLFILNELLSWCKHKKFKAMAFKVDFEKASDSTRWDFLQDILKMFGFGDKWCGWINGCLNSAMGSVLVNGSRTSEFQFHKGLFSSIPIDSSLILSHIFFADDALFVGLKIKFHKSKFMGIGTHLEEVKAAATTMGCLIFTTP
ncbi:RNA-directed DNA polymerase, eukaryota, partial [Tanacetum coccineum]